ncbi:MULTISPECIES: hypothetical protein [unclassified Actinotalea]|uniref:hypothetical protein n=1 Tax=unclassified Actinotalea TaxID=2638618 RepID=UPI0015F77E78|nr:MULTISPECIES: hypothetical protein [unclassified Actinotalea]
MAGHVSGEWTIPSTVGSRSTRAALRTERAQLARWRRLVRARLDLAVAALAPPDHVGAMTWDLLPEAQMALPAPQELVRAVTVATPRDQDPVALLEHLRHLDQRLAAYGAALDAALETTARQACLADAMAPDAR